MSWWFWVWVVVLAVVSIGAARDDWQDHRTRDAIFGLASGAICILAVVAFASEGVASLVGRGLAPLTVLAGLFLVYSGIRVLEQVPDDPEFSARANRVLKVIGATFAVLTFGSAIVVGVTKGAQAW